MASTQNRKWAIIKEQVDAFEKNFHILRDSNQMLISNQQPNFNLDTFSPFLPMIHASIKSYRSALFAYHVNLFEAIPVLIRCQLPMSFIPIDSPIFILESR